jgi:flagellar hook-associated protein 2
MSGITSNVGVFSGIDAGRIIDQLIQIEARPRTALQQRVVTLQTQQTAFLDVNTRLSGLKSAIQRFTQQRVFDASTATSSKAETLTATAGNGAAVGSYSFTVDRLVTTQQVLSRGFADRTSTGLGLTSVVVESAAAKVTRSTRLADLNGGDGIVRGKIQITDSSGQRAVVDLSKVETLEDVVTAIREATGGRVEVGSYPDSLFLTDRAGGVGMLTVADLPGTTGTAASLGIAGNATDPGDGGALIGQAVVRLGSRTALTALNDGRGVFISNRGGTTSEDFQITARDGTVIKIDIGDIYENVTPSGGGDPTLTRTRTAVSELGGVVERINQQSGGKITASINPTTRALQLVDSTGGSGILRVEELAGGSTAKDLGLLGTSNAPTLVGRQVLAGAGSTLVSGLRGGQGLAGTTMTVTTRDGFTTVVGVPNDGSVDDLLGAISSGSGGRFAVELDSTRTRAVFRDLTTGSGPLSISGGVAETLRLTTTSTTSTSVTGGRLDRQYVGPATLLSDLNGGRGIGSGQIAITDSYGSRSTITIGDSTQNVSDLLQLINSRFSNLRAQINEAGNGIELIEVAKPEGAGSSRIKVEDVNGAVARALNLRGEASGTGTANKIDGSYRRTVTLAATDTLQQVADKLSNSDAGVIAAVVNDQASSRPFRLSLTSRSSGESGRFVVESAGGQLDFSTLSEGSNARVFFGSSDPARALLLSSTTNSVAGVVPGLTVDVKSADANPVTVSVTRDTAALEKALDDLATAFNGVIDRLDNLTSFNAETRRRGPLLGDATVQTLRQELNAVINARAEGVSGRFTSLAEVGVRFNRDGALEINKERLREAISQDADAVEQVLTARVQAANTGTREIAPGITVAENTAGAVTTRGVLQRLQDAVDKYIRPVDGLLTRRNDLINTQVRAQNTRIETLNTRLESRRALLTRQFADMEKAIGRLQSQQSSVSGIRSVAG